MTANIPYSFAIICSGLEPIVEERLRMLDEALAFTKGSPLPLERIAEALVLPMARKAINSFLADGDILNGLKHWFVEPSSVRHEVQVFLKPSVQRFTREVRRTLPDVPESEVNRRMQLAVSSMLGTLARLDIFAGVAEGEEELWSTAVDLCQTVTQTLRGDTGPTGPRKNFLLKDGATWHIIDRDQIRYIQSDGNYSCVCFDADRKAHVRRSMTEWMNLLERGQFRRARRSLIVNIDHIARMESMGNGRLRLWMASSDQYFISSRRYTATLRQDAASA